MHRIHDNVREKYLTIDPLNGNPQERVKYTQSETDAESDATVFTVDQNTFHPGTFTIRQGDYFIYAGQEHSCKIACPRKFRKRENYFSCKVS